jgi:hypothetical protein
MWLPYLSLAFHISTTVHTHESSCPGGQIANDPKLRENQLNIKWDLTGQILHEDLWEGSAIQCYNEREPVKMSGQFTLLETVPGVLQHNSKMKPLRTPSWQRM